MLTKYNFPLTHFFWCYQTLENTKNYLHTTFSIKTNKHIISLDSVTKFYHNNNNINIKYWPSYHFCWVLYCLFSRLKKERILWRADCEKTKIVKNPDLLLIFKGHLHWIHKNGRQELIMQWHTHKGLLNKGSC